MSQRFVNADTQQPSSSVHLKNSAWTVRNTSWSKKHNLSKLEWYRIVIYRYCQFPRAARLPLVRQCICRRIRPLICGCNGNRNSNHQLPINQLKVSIHCSVGCDGQHFSKVKKRQMFFCHSSSIPWSEVEDKSHPLHYVAIYNWQSSSKLWRSCTNWR